MYEFKNEKLTQTQSYLRELAWNFYCEFKIKSLMLILLADFIFIMYFLLVEHFIVLNLIRLYIQCLELKW